MFGIETEYALAGLSANGGSIAVQPLVNQLLELAMSRCAYLPDVYGAGIFLQNGSRFYVDCGMHPELGTPECTNPWDAVRYILAGERILAGLADQLKSRLRDAAEVACLRCNVDYSGTQATWGCHESYLHRVDPSVLPRQIIPHLVSRVIYTGAGGFNPLAAGLRFAISPRTAHMVKVVSRDSTANRGIFHTKDESLCGDGYHRLHILSGESLCSEIATWLKVGATALVVALIDAGQCPGEEVQLYSPLDALRTFSSDPECKATVKLTDRRRWSAVEIQRHYLAQAEANLGKDFMPAWAAEVCRQWRAMLDRLGNAPASVSTTLDWAIKRALYENRARRHGFTWESVLQWSHVLERLRAALSQTEFRDRAVSVDFVLDPKSPVADEVNRLIPFLRENGLNWDGLAKFLSLRQQLFEVDMRFGQLGGKGIFGAMDRAGVLAHHFPGVDNIEHAAANPPAAGRARLRGELVKRLTGNHGRYRADWQGVWDYQEKRMVDLSDPFGAEERWRSLSEAQGTTLDAQARMHRHLLEDLEP